LLWRYSRQPPFWSDDRTRHPRHEPPVLVAALPLSGQREGQKYGETGDLLQMGLKKGEILLLFDESVRVQKPRRSSTAAAQPRSFSTIARHSNRQLLRLRHRTRNSSFSSSLGFVRECNLATILPAQVRTCFGAFSWLLSTSRLPGKPIPKRPISS